MRSWRRCREAPRTSTIAVSGGAFLALPDAVVRHAADRGTSPALVTTARTWTWRELERETAALATGFVASSDRGPVAVMLDPGPDPVLLTWALARAGRPLVVLHPTSTVREVAHVLRDAGCTGVIAGARHTGTVDEALEGRPVERWCSGGESSGWVPLDVLRELEPGPLPHVGEDDVLRIQYTSGTTGEPKGAVQTHRSQVLLFAVLALTTGIRPGERMLLASSLSSHGGFVQSTMPMWLGGTLVLRERFDPADALATIGDHGVSATFMVPTMFNALLAELDAHPGRHDVSSLRVVMTGSAPRADSVRRGMLEHFEGAGVHELYGTTECGLATCLLPEDQERARTVGRPVLGASVSVRDPDGVPLTAPGEAGEIWVRTPTLASGYLGRPDATAAAFVDGWHRTGDLGSVDDAGYLTLLDRRDDLVVTGGLNVYPAEVESVLLDAPGVLEAAVVGVPSERWGHEVTAVVVARPGCRLSPEEVARFARSQLAAFKCPKHVQVWPSLPRNAAGKVLRREVRARLGGGR
jgi:fatty-acyl-CoA synthase